MLIPFAYYVSQLVYYRIFGSVFSISMIGMGADAVEKIEGNPYLLCMSDIGFSFDRADAIGASLGIAQDSDSRVEMGVLHVLRHNSGNGHTCLPENKVTAVAANLLSVSMDAAEMAVERLCQSGRLSRFGMDEKSFIALPTYYKSEKYIAGRLSMMLRFPPAPIYALPERIDAIETANGISYGERQRQAIMKALSDGVLVLTGGPGTGKTTTIKAIIHLLEQQKLEVALAAPTGRAAKRMTDLTGVEAKTIHRLLEVEWGEEDRLVFSKNEKNPLNVDAVIVDELSMVDVTLFEALLKAMRLGCRLIMVGDENQLPAVGAGNVLGDIIAAGSVPVVCLNTIFRQAMESMIITNAHEIVAGRQPELTRRDGDFFMVHEANPVRGAKLLQDLCAKRLPAAYGLDPLQDIQLLCPSRMGETGTNRMNQLLSSVLNPPEFGKTEISLKRGVLRQGDKVMQVRNNYDIVWTGADGKQGSGVFNGDIGLLLSIDHATGILSVRFDDKIAIYSQDDANDLEQAYAITVHKSQGSEYECVVIPVVGIPEKLSYRNLLYTGVTRAKRLLVLVGTDMGVENMVNNNVKSLRYTMLVHMLKESKMESEKPIL
jgi:exodeoxyribonuclease V alpha subunit